MVKQIKIQIGQIFMNKTRKYLYPIIKQHGTDFVFKFNSIFKVAIGIGDILVENCGFKHEKHLFILVDSRYKPSEFIRTIKWLRKHHSYEDDYVFGDITTSRFHMIVVKIPEQYIPSLQRFKESKFSKMYSKEDVKKFFSFVNRTGSDKILYKNINRVLVHDHNYKIQFAEQLKEEFEIDNLTINDIADDVEFDLPIKEIEEIFNYKE